MHLFVSCFQFSTASEDSPIWVVSTKLFSVCVGITAKTCVIVQGVRGGVCGVQWRSAWLPRVSQGRLPAQPHLLLRLPLPARYHCCRPTQVRWSLGRALQIVSLIQDFNFENVKFRDIKLHLLSEHCSSWSRVLSAHHRYSGVFVLERAYAWDYRSLSPCRFSPSFVALATIGS